jgi:hypothetical protein
MLSIQEPAELVAALSATKADENWPCVHVALSWFFKVNDFGFISLIFTSLLIRHWEVTARVLKRELRFTPATVT